MKIRFLHAFIGSVLALLFLSVLGCAETLTAEESKAVNLIKQDPEAGIVDQTYENTKLHANCTYEKFLSTAKTVFGQAAGVTEEQKAALRDAFDSAKGCYLTIERKLEKTGESRVKATYTLRIPQTCELGGEIWIGEDRIVFNIDLETGEVEPEKPVPYQQMGYFNMFGECTSQALTMTMSFGTIESKPVQPNP